MSDSSVLGDIHGAISADYTITHLGLPPQLRKQITHTYYPAGHMLYHDAASRQKLHDDVAQFMQTSVR